MLYIIYSGISPDIEFKGGQDSILHLEFDLKRVIHWADNQKQNWAIALSNASAHYTEFRNDLSGINELNWAAINNSNFRQPEVKEAKQAEFLVYSAVPWELVEQIGVCNWKIQKAAQLVIQAFAHKPTIEVQAKWYYYCSSKRYCTSG